jgi:RimJ/RimL family protein N-acetyltransferase
MPLDIREPSAVGPDCDACAVQVHFEPVVMPEDAEAAVEFLTASEWPYHAQSALSREHAAAICLSGDDVVSFWVKIGGKAVGLVRAFDLEDVGEGSPLLDIRLAAAYRGRGVGTTAVAWVVDHLFTRYADLHRIEATTRHDNVPMQRVFDRCGFRLEGRMLEAWTNADGSRSDAWVYALLRREWSARI